MLTHQQIVLILNQIQYKDWEFRFIEKGGCRFLQIGFFATDSETGERSYQKGRKWLLSEHMTASELVSTALKAVLTAEEHEAREQFLYRGRAVFGPHIDVDSLWTTCLAKDIRPEPEPEPVTLALEPISFG